MIELPVFELIEPESVPEAVEALVEHGNGATLVAGGTGLFPTMKRRQVHHPVVISLGKIPGLSGIKAEDGRVAIGALTPLLDVAGSTEVPTAVADAASQVATPQIRALGTAGGNLLLDTRCNYYDMPEVWRAAQGDCLKAGGDICWVAPKGDRCWAVSSSDLAPVALAMGARFTFWGKTGSRELEAAAVYQDDGLVWLTRSPHDVLTEVSFPLGFETAYVKLRRRDTLDFPMLGVAVALVRDGEEITDARIGLGAVSSAPRRAMASEESLIGRRLAPDVIEVAAEKANDAIRPLDNADVSSRYRRAMIPVFVKRALNRLSTAGSTR